MATRHGPATHGTLSDPVRATAWQGLWRHGQPWLCRHPSPLASGSRGHGAAAPPAQGRPPNPCGGVIPALRVGSPSLPPHLGPPLPCPCAQPSAHGPPTSGRQLLGVDDLGCVLMAGTELDTASHHGECTPGRQTGTGTGTERKLVSLPADAQLPHEARPWAELCGLSPQTAAAPTLPQPSRVLPWQQAKPSQSPDPSPHGSAEPRVQLALCRVPKA